MTPTTRNEMAKKMLNLKLKKRFFENNKTTRECPTDSSKGPLGDVITVASDSEGEEFQDHPCDNRKRSPASAASNEKKKMRTDDASGEDDIDEE